MPLDLCATTAVRRKIESVGIYTNTAISNEIVEQTRFLYNDHGDPLSAIISHVDEDDDNSYYKRFYVGERNIFRVDRVFIGTTTKRELTSTTDFTTSTTHGMIKMTSGTTLGGIDIDDSDEVIVWYVPGIYEDLCAVRVGEKLLGKTETTDGGAISKELEVMREKRKEYEDHITNKNNMLLTGQFTNYDEDYDVNMKSLVQKFKRNGYLYP